jgi:hemerythrin superfamily protein
MHNHRNTPRDIAVLAGGLALGMLASKLVPVIASARGSMQTRAGGDPFDMLIEDHQTILSTLDSMQRHSNSTLARRSALFLRLKRTLGKHAMAEEDIVYPLLHRQSGEEENAKELYDDHAEIKIHLYELEQLLRSNGDWTERVRSLTDLIREHAREEEEQEFPKLRQLLSEDRTRATAPGLCPE